MPQVSCPAVMPTHSSLSSDLRHPLKLCSTTTLCTCCKPKSFTHLGYAHIMLEPLNDVLAIGAQSSSSPLLSYGKSIMPASVGGTMASTSTSIGFMSRLWSIARSDSVLFLL